jgi:hypothetical protein
MKVIILKSYKNQGDSELATTGYRIDGKMENNPFFPDPPPALGKLKKLVPEYHNSVWNAKGRDSELISVKNDKKAELVALLTELDEYVTQKCNGDRTMLLSSGFPISGEKGEQQMSAIPKLDVEIGPPGEAITRIRRVAGGRAYLHQYTTEPPSSDTVWTSEVSTYAYHTFNGLRSTEKYWFRVVAIGAAEQRVYSPVMWRVIQ